MGAIETSKIYRPSQVPSKSLDIIMDEARTSCSLLIQDGKFDNVGEIIDHIKDLLHGNGILTNNQRIKRRIDHLILEFRGE